MRDVFYIPSDPSAETKVLRFHQKEDCTPYYPDGYYSKSGQTVLSGPTINNDPEGYGLFFSDAQIKEAGGPGGHALII